MFIHAKPAPLLITAVLLATLAACRKPGADTDASAATAASAGAPAPAAPGTAPAAAIALPTGDPATPLTSYRKIDSGNQVMFQYYALSNLPVAYDDIAEAYSAEYRATSDSFKRKDIVAALKPRIEQEIAHAKAGRYLLLEESNNTLLERYNFEKKTFAIKHLASNDRYTYFNDNSRYTLTTTNAPAFSSLSIPDEAKARAIEDYISKYAQLRMEVLAFAQDADLSERRVKLQVMKVRLYSPSNELLAEI